MRKTISATGERAGYSGSWPKAGPREQTRANDKMRKINLQCPFDPTNMRRKYITFCLRSQYVLPMWKHKQGWLVRQPDLDC